MSYLDARKMRIIPSFQELWENDCLAWVEHIRDAARNFIMHVTRESSWRITVNTLRLLLIWSACGMWQELLQHFAWIDTQLGLWKEGLAYRNQVKHMQVQIAATEIQLNSQLAIARDIQNVDTIAQMRVTNPCFIIR